MYTCTQVLCDRDLSLINDVEREHIFKNMVQLCIIPMAGLRSCFMSARGFELDRFGCMVKLEDFKKIGLIM